MRAAFALSDRSFMKGGLLRILQVSSSNKNEKEYEEWLEKYLHC